jgi:hypothetical protein
MGLDHATQMKDARDKVNDLAENTLRLSQAAEATSKAAEQQRALDASMLAQAAKNPDPNAYRKALGSLPYDRAKVFADAGVTDPAAILKLGMQPAQVATAEHEAKTAQTESDRLIEDKRYHDLQSRLESGKLGVEQAKLALDNKKFVAQFGTPESRSAFTDSVVQNPDSYFSLPAEMKPGVAADLVARGLSVPVQVPGDLKTRAASAGLTLAAIGRVRNLLADPDIQGAIGPISGRLGNVEQNVGDTFFGENDPRAQKEQQLRTELAYLKFQESKGLFGGRPAQQLIKSLSSVSANPKMSQNVINGSLNAMENSVKAVSQVARAYSFGGASGAAPKTGGGKTYTQADADAVIKAHPELTPAQADAAFKAKGWVKQ